MSARGDGKRKIAGKLRTRGIDPEIIGTILQHLDGDIPEEEAAWQSLQKKKLLLMRESDDRKRKEKAVRYLAGHGFSASAAFSAWERFRQEMTGKE